jgi:hypothetical protein
MTASASASRAAGALLTGLAITAGILTSLVLATSRASAVPLSAPAPAASPSPPAGHWPPPFVLSVGTANGDPVAGRQYQFYVEVTSETVPGWNINLQIWLTPGLTLPPGAPPGCFPVPGGLDCGLPYLPKGETDTLTITVSVSGGLAAGTPVGISAQLRYDWIWWAYASVSRPVTVITPPPPPPHTSPPPPPPPHRSPPPPPPTHHPRPAPLVHHPTPTPTPTPTPSHRPPPPRHKPRPQPTPVPSIYHAMLRKALTPPIAPPAPVIPLGVLITAVMTPCVAAAATRFGKSVHHGAAPPPPGPHHR